MIKLGLKIELNARGWPKVFEMMFKDQKEKLMQKFELAGWLQQGHI